MDTILDFLLTFAVLSGMAFIVAQMSKDREIGFWTLFAVSVFFTPFIGIIVGLFSRKKRDPNARPPQGKPEASVEPDKFWERFMPKKGEDTPEPPPPTPSVPKGKGGAPRRKRNKGDGSSNRRVNL